ncbi:MAG: hypothetical protein AAF646_15060 [Pseudomonadota bacterium]
MEILQRLESFRPLIDEAGTWLSTAREDATLLGQSLLALELPVPDLALVGAFILAVVATMLAQRGKTQDACRQVEALYQAELLTANRRAQQARGALRSAKLEIERERQRRRREAQTVQRSARIASNPPIPLNDRIAVRK